MLFWNGSINGTLLHSIEVYKWFFGDTDMEFVSGINNSESLLYEFL